MTFTTFSTCVYHQHTNTFCLLFHKNIISFWNMTTSRTLSKNTRWENTDNKTSTLHRHPKLLKPTETYLFNLLPTIILADIDIWVSSLKHHEKFKSFAKKMNYLSNPVFFVIPHDLWAPCQNFGVYIWYNEGFYEWEYRRIPAPYSDSCSHYQLYQSFSIGITKLTPTIIQSHMLAVTFQKTTQDRNSSIPYFKQKILDSDKEHHATHDTPTFLDPQPRWTHCTIKSAIYY